MKFDQFRTLLKEYSLVHWVVLESFTGKYGKMVKPIDINVFTFACNQTLTKILDIIHTKNAKYHCINEDAWVTIIESFFDGFMTVFESELN
jgi:hypothetical protein